MRVSGVTPLCVALLLVCVRVGNTQTKRTDTKPSGGWEKRGKEGHGGTGDSLCPAIPSPVHPTPRRQSLLHSPFSHTQSSHPTTRHRSRWERAKTALRQRAAATAVEFSVASTPQLRAPVGGAAATRLHSHHAVRSRRLEGGKRRCGSRNRPPNAAQRRAAAEGAQRTHTPRHPWRGAFTRQFSVQRV